MTKPLTCLKDLEKTGVWEQGLKDLLLPRHILPPENYPSPKHFAWGLHCNVAGLLMQVRQNPDCPDQKKWEAAIWTSLLHQWINHEGPVFFLEENTLEMLLETTPPEDFSTEDCQLPMPVFGLVLPLQEEHPLLLISTFDEEKNPNQLLPEKAEQARKIPARLEEEPQVRNILDHYTYPNHVEIPKSGHKRLCVHAGETKGGWLGGWCKLQPQSALSSLENYRKEIEETYKDEPEQDHYTPRLLQLTINFLCWLKYHHKETIPHPKTTKGETKLHNKKSGKTFFSPILLQEEKTTGEKVYRSKIEERKKAACHWRRGHWHTILFGAKKSERTRKWFKPTLVNNPKKSTLRPNEDGAPALQGYPNPARVCSKTGTQTRLVPTQALPPLRRL